MTRLLKPVAIFLLVIALPLIIYGEFVTKSITILVVALGLGLLAGLFVFLDWRFNVRPESETEKQTTLPPVTIPKEVMEPVRLPTEPRYNETSGEPVSWENAAIAFLKVMAFMNLIGGIILALFTWALEKGLPIIGFGWLLAGTSAFAVLIVFCSIAESLIEIRKRVVSFLPEKTGIGSLYRIKENT